MSSEQDKDLVAKRNACCMQSTQRGVAIIFPSEQEHLSEDPAPLAHTLSAARSAQNAPLVIC